MLATAWTTVERTVYEITATTPGTGSSVRDLAGLNWADGLDIHQQPLSLEELIAQSEENLGRR